MRTPSISQIIVLLLCVSLAPIVSAQTAAPGTVQTPSGRVFGKWQYLCPESEACRIAQSVVTIDGQRPVAVVRVFKEDPAAITDAAKAKPKDKSEPGAVGVITLPLGIFLAPGFALKIDEGKARRFAYESCDERGCHLGIKFDKPLFAEMAKGKIVTIQFFDSTQKPAVLNLPLEGFSAAYEAMK
jgi:invasion protein IalB